MIDYAYTKYIATVHSPEWVTLYTETNDDEDTGYPGVFASWVSEFKGADAIKHCRKTTGVSRQGIGHRVFVIYDGQTIERETDFERIT